MNFSFFFSSSNTHLEFQIFRFVKTVSFDRLNALEFRWTMIPNRNRGIYLFIGFTVVVAVVFFYILSLFPVVCKHVFNEISYFNQKLYRHFFTALRHTDQRYKKKTRRILGGNISFVFSCTLPHSYGEKPDGRTIGE